MLKKSVMFTNVFVMLTQYLSLFMTYLQKRYQNDRTSTYVIVCVCLFSYSIDKKIAHCCFLLIKLKIKNCIMHSSFRVSCWKHTYFLGGALRLRLPKGQLSTLLLCTHIVHCNTWSVFQCSVIFPIFSTYFLLSLFVLLKISLYIL